jgi:hypothetical protein
MDEINIGLKVGCFDEEFTPSSTINIPGLSFVRFGALPIPMAKMGPKGGCFHQ